MSEKRKIENKKPEPDRREFLKKMAASSVFVLPVIQSFSLIQLQSTWWWWTGHHHHHWNNHHNQPPPPPPPPNPWS